MNTDLGYLAGVSGGVVKDNWFMRGTPNVMVKASVSSSGNHFSTGSGGKRPVCPAGAVCGIPGLTGLMRADRYESGRGLITVINLAGKPALSVTVNVAALGYANGEWVTVASAEDYFGARRAFQVVGGCIVLPLRGWTVATPAAWNAPASTLPGFGAFILRRKF